MSIAAMHAPASPVRGENGNHAKRNVRRISAGRSRGGTAARRGNRESSASSSRAAARSRPEASGGWKFGMLKWLDAALEQGWDWTSTAYLGLAFD